jgi:hypothetical protein
MNAAPDTGPTRMRRTPQAANHAGLLTLLQGGLYQGPVPTQACFKGWRHEAARLANLYRLTGRELHKLAFERHVAGILLQVKEGGQ